MNRKKILHLLQPDKKFIGLIINSFNSHKEIENTYIIIQEKNKLDLSHSSLVLPDNVIVYIESEESFEKIIVSFNHYDALITHGLSLFRARLINKAPQSLKIGWFLFGFEFYSLPIMRNAVLSKKTKQKLNKLHILGGLRRSYIYSKIVGLVKDHSNYVEVINSMKRVDVIGTLAEEEAQLVKSKLNLRLKHAQYILFNLEESLLGINHKSIGYNIIVGNSSTPTNNHLDVLDLLSNLDLGDSKVIVPLSYGNQKYRNIILSKGSELLQRNFYPLTSFLGKDEYNDLLSTCGFAIMNHYRQQALGNILPLLWIGAKVFLNKRSPVYSYLKRMGFIVFSVDDLKNDLSLVMATLPEQDRELNRNLVSSTFSKKNVDAINSTFVGTLL